jgi:hypothetical protein
MSMRILLSSIGSSRDEDASVGDNVFYLYLLCELYYTFLAVVVREWDAPICTIYVNPMPYLLATGGSSPTAQ